MIGIDPFDLVRAECMLIGYHERWKDEPYAVLGVEQEFRAPLINPDTGAASRTWQLAGKLDALVRDLTDGRVLIVEHKTTSADVGPGTDYIKRLRLDGQVSIYFEGAAALGLEPAACLYDVLVKPGQRPLKATPIENRKYTKDGRLYAAQRDRDETAAEYRERVMTTIAEDPNGHYLRAEVVRLDSERDEARAELWQQGRMIRENQLAGRHPRNPDACVRFGRTCEYFGVCTGEASLTDPVLFQRATCVHPELEDNTDQLLTASRLACARACQRAHRHRYFDGIRPVIEADALRFGTLVHRGLQAWWSAPRDERLDAALNAITGLAPAEV